LRTYQPASLQTIKRHTLWHPIYLGFGFLKNDYGLEFNDQVALDKIKAVSPNTPHFSEDYEDQLKKETVSFIRSHPWFTIFTFLIKSAIVVFYFLVFANVGLFMAFKHRKPWPVDLAFFVALAANAAFGILVIPLPKYLLGFIAFSILYGMVSINEALEPGKFSRSI
jgi:hypothetical protein